MEQAYPSGRGAGENRTGRHSSMTKTSDEKLKGSTRYTNWATLQPRTGDLARASTTWRPVTVKHSNCSTVSRLTPSSMARCDGDGGLHALKERG